VRSFEMRLGAGDDGSKKRGVYSTASGGSIEVAPCPTLAVFDLYMGSLSTLIQLYDGRVVSSSQDAREQS
jgi:hypothetical protein